MHSKLRFATLLAISYDSKVILARHFKREAARPGAVGPTIPRSTAGLTAKPLSISMFSRYVSALFLLTNAIVVCGNGAATLTRLRAEMDSQADLTLKSVQVWRMRAKQQRAFRLIPAITGVLWEGFIYQQRSKDKCMHRIWKASSCCTKHYQAHSFCGRGKVLWVRGASAAGYRRSSCPRPWQWIWSRLLCRCSFGWGARFGRRR